MTDPMPDIVERRQLIEVFGAGHLLTVPPDRLPASLTHEPTRRFLTEAGFPDEEAHGFLWVDEHLTTGMRPFPEADFFDDVECPPECRDHLLLGEQEAAVVGAVGIDGTSGTVHLVSELDVTAPVVLNSSIAHLAYFLYIFARYQPVYSADNYPENAPEEYWGRLLVDVADFMRKKLMKADPVAFEHPENIWDSCLEEVATGAWS
ncbi:SUKH-4 family immunity protein [Thermomonospora catenispora]|uniref:SUKH-4 family immunity protein n=1 Tax=Thermomonospora catenispora TaxID=2493090 RepID=UPI0013756BB5|nr:SUKH-4 family immunity protein [Thermomonospora catenispora]